MNAKNALKTHYHLFYQTAKANLGGLLFGVAPVDPLTFGAVGALMFAVGMTASYVPARRASSVDPIESLRAG